MEHWECLHIPSAERARTLPAFLPPMLDSKTLLQVAHDPHLANQVFVKREIYRREVLDQKPWH